MYGKDEKIPWILENMFLQLGSFFQAILPVFRNLFN